VPGKGEGQDLIASKGAPIAMTDELNVERYDKVIDVRSPSEYAEDHIPGAVNLPVLDDAERARVGTIYVQDNAFSARKIGAAIVSENIARMLEGPLAECGKEFHPLIYCWRGGQRSGALASVLSQIGWRCTLLRGGYKSFRRRVVADLATRPGGFTFLCLSGLTGAGKTRILQAMAVRGFQVLDLEQAASHRGSVLGAQPGEAQPSQKAFETRLWQALKAFDTKRPVWLESESSKIGNVSIPAPVWAALRQADRVEISVDVETRAGILLEDYAGLIAMPEVFAEKLMTLTVIHGKKKIALWHDMIHQRAWRALARDLLESHYDPAYRRALKRHKNKIRTRYDVHTLSPEAIDALIDKLESRNG